MDQKKIDRINELAKLAKQRELTAEEQEERATLRAEYIAAFRGNLEAQLNTITIQYPDGSKKKLSKKPLNET
ncbi:MAG: DUF896 domain-containing protein [Clostridia bacterium]|nr:DUF896 domain-containing protein [Clostridia bacterium]